MSFICLAMSMLHLVSSALVSCTQSYHLYARKVCVLAHKCIYGNATKYFRCTPNCLLSYAPCSRPLRSVGTKLEFSSRSRLSRSAAFRCDAPRCWNSLPRAIRQTANFHLLKKFEVSPFYPGLCRRLLSTLFTLLDVFHFENDIVVELW